MATVTITLGALAVAGAGNVAVFAAAAAEAAESSGALAAGLQGGGSAAAVAGLVYVARLVVKGELVPRPVKDSETELHAGILAAAQREAKVLELAETCIEQQSRSQKQHDMTLTTLTEVNRSLTDVATEMQYWREMRDRGTRREDRGPTHREGPR